MVSVVPDDGRLSGTARTATARVQNSPPNTPVLQWGVANPEGGVALDCNVVTPVADPDGDTVYYRYTWHVNGVQRAINYSTTSRTNPLAASITSDGGLVTCKVEAYDGSNWSPAQTLSATLASSCTWTPVVSYSLATTPSGYLIYTGAVGTQGVATVAGRSAWLQSSDANQFYVPSGVTSSDDVVATQVDFYAPADSVFVLGTQNEKAGINDIIRGFDVGYDRVLNQFGVTANSASSRQNACCSPTVALGVSPALGPAPINAWRTLRVEHRKLGAGRVRVYLDGTELFGVSGSSVISWTGRYIRLDSSSAATFSPSNVAFSNLKVERGTGGCFKSNNSPCGSSAECASGQCVDGVCCDTACTGTCQACNVTGRVGTCSVISDGQDPADECTGAQVCNGSGGCR
jgi:hypothetical protein